jgi:hypothetical protein
MKPLPDIRTMLPSAATEALTGWLLEQLETTALSHASGLRSLYTYGHALGDISEIDSQWACLRVHDCFEQALQQFNRRYPLCWSNQNQCAYRTRPDGTIVVAGEKCVSRVK